MKLTKGKISKLYNKKKQTLKKPKKKTSRKIKTFRNKKHLNLERKTLKRHYKKRRGGADNNTNILSPTKSITNSDDNMSPIKDINNEIDLSPITIPQIIEPEEENVPPVEQSEQPNISEDENVTPVEQPSQPTISEDENVTPVEQPVEQLNQSEDENVTPVEQPVEPQNLSENENVTPVEQPSQPTLLEENVTPVEQPVEQLNQSEDENITPVEQLSQPTLSEENVTPVEQLNQPEEDDKPTEVLNSEPTSELINSISQIVDYMANSVAEKVSERVLSGQSGENIQNGFSSVNTAARNMSGGSKFKHTRKFRLTNKKNN